MCFRIILCVQTISLSHLLLLLHEVYKYNLDKDWCVKYQFELHLRQKGLDDEYVGCVRVCSCALCIPQSALWLGYEADFSPPSSVKLKPQGRDHLESLGVGWKVFEKLGMNWIQASVISGFHCGVNEVFNLLRC